MRGRPPDSQSVQPHDQVQMRQAQLKLERQTSGNGWNTNPKILATPTAPISDCVGSDPGRYPADNNLNPAVMCTAVAVAVIRDSALTNNVNRGMTYSASPKAAVNETHPVDDSVAVAVHRKTELTDDVDRGIAYAANTAGIDSELTRSLCKLMGVVYCDINCSSSKESDCIGSDPVEARLA